MDRYWFLTWRTYGTWLPGEDGFVGYYRWLTGECIIENAPGGEFADPMPALAEYTRGLLKTAPVLLDSDDAQCLIGQFHETAAYRGWAIDAVAVPVNHVHVVFGVPGDPDPAKMLGDWKSYGSRALNRRCGRRSDWWAVSGSRRPLKSAERRWAAIRYVRDQENALLIWLSDEAIALLAEPP
jgi:REP element-mobilizing transposase RayT